MQRYSSEPDDPWFRVGTIDVNSSLLVAALCTVSMLVYAIDKDLLAWLALISDNPFGPAFLHGVRQGQVWRVVTWPTFNPPEIWTFLSIVIIWYFGKELERFLGRVRYLWFVGIVVVFPSIVYVLLVPTLVAPTVIIAGSYMLASAMVIAFIATYPGAVGFFGVPFWIIAVVFEALRVLQLVGDRLWDNLLFLVVMMSTSLLMTRAFGLSELEWIPKIPLPASLSGESRRRAAKPGRSPRRGRKGPATVTPIRPPNSTPTSADLLRQAEIDVLLDKINEHGIGSLTPEERRRLDEHSRRMREER